MRDLSTPHIEHLVLFMARTSLTAWCKNVKRGMLLRTLDLLPTRPRPCFRPRVPNIPAKKSSARIYPRSKSFAWALSVARTSGQSSPP